MIFLYSHFLIFNKLSHLNNYGWPNFSVLAPILYILYWFLCNETLLLKFTYKIISIRYTVSNTHKKDDIKIS